MMQCISRVPLAEATAIAVALTNRVNDKPWCDRPARTVRCRGFTGDEREQRWSFDLADDGARDNPLGILSHQHRRTFNGIPAADFDLLPPLRVVQ